MSTLLNRLPGKILRVKELGPINLAMKTEEDKIRKLFLENPQHELLKNPFVHLLDVYDPKNVETFVFPSPSENDATLPLVFEWRRWTGFGHSITPKQKYFENTWNNLCPLLKGLNWNNVVAAGGSVLGALMKYVNCFDLWLIFAKIPIQVPQHRRYNLIKCILNI